MIIQYTIVPPQGEKKTVDVTFFEEGKPELFHKRQVNAAFDENGVYDEVATAERVEQVALGVAHKLSVGAIDLVGDVNESVDVSQEQPAQ